jgi:hypothetical protein
MATIGRITDKEINGQEDLMKSKLFVSAALVIMLAALLTLLSGCFTSGSSSTPTTSSTQAVKPKPSVENVIATTSGTADAYFATLDIKVKNEGAEGIILVIGKITQAGQTTQREMPVFLKDGESHEIKLTFPLVWRGGDFTSNVETLVP